MELKDLIEQIDIVDYIAQFVDLEEKNGEYWGLSPFKDEKTPSFSVRRETGKFFDYSSGIGGNLYTFIRYFKKVSSKEAVSEIKKLAGYDGDVAEPTEKLQASVCCKKYAVHTPHEKESKVTILPDNYMERYESRPDKIIVWENEGISKETLEKFQVKYDSFSDRLVYPIRNPDGKIVNVGGRTLDPKWKEKGQRKYCYFKSWGRMQTIYGFAENLEYIKKKRQIILFEGCKSVLIAYTWGIKNCGAILTSHLNPEQMKLLIQLGADVVFALDKDVKIREDHNIEKLRRFVNVSYLYDAYDLLEDKDSPVDKGRETFEFLMSKRFRYK